MEPNSRAELSSLIEAGLGHAIDDQVLDALHSIRRRLQEEQDYLAYRLNESVISKEEYLRELETSLRKAQSDGERLLGMRQFQDIFGELTLAALKR